MPSPLRPYLEAERPQPVLLPQAERRQLRRRKEAALTDIAARYRKRGLLWAYEIGVEIVDVQDQRLEDPDLDLGPIDFRRFGVGRSQGYDHAQMARYVRRDWVMAAPDSNLTTTFHEIARGEPPLKEWIRQELCRFACRTRCTTDRMKQVRRGLEESLDGLAPEAPAPTPEWLGALIEELASRPEDPRALLARLHKKFRPFLRKLHRAGVLDAGQDLLLDLMKEVAGQERRQAPRDAEETSAAETGAAGAAAPSPEIGPPALPDPAPDPERVYLCQNDLPVPYPANDYGVSPAERHAACLVIVLSAIATACRTIIPCRNLVYPISPRRALCAYDRLNLFESRMLALVPLLAGAVARHQQRQPPGAPAPLPLSTDPEDGHRLPMAWVSYEAADPLDEPDPSNLDLWFCHLFGLLDCGGGLLDQFLERYRTDLMADDLLFQLDRAIDLCHLPLLEVALYLRRPAEEARELAQKEQERLALLRPVLEAAQERTRVLGEEGPVPLYTVFARTDDGSPLAITQNTPQLVLAQGRQGGGKSHALKLMWEGCAHPHPGLGKSDGPRLCVRIGSDWQQGTGGDEVRGGFYPNRDPAQWDLLRTDYLVERTNAAVRRAHLLCYPESVEPFKRRYADLVERGLVIEPLALDPSEVGLFRLRRLPERRRRGAQARPPRPGGEPDRLARGRRHAPEARRGAVPAPGRQPRQGLAPFAAQTPGAPDCPRPLPDRQAGQELADGGAPGEPLRGPGPGGADGSDDPERAGAPAPKRPGPVPLVLPGGAQPAPAQHGDGGISQGGGDAASPPAQLLLRVRPAGQRLAGGLRGAADDPDAVQHAQRGGVQEVAGAVRAP